MAKNHPDTTGLATEIKEKIQTDDGYCIAALLKLHSFQTYEEQNHRSTATDNGRGFNKIDAFVLSDISEFYITKGYLTEKQVNFVRSKIIKYHKQLIGYGIMPVTNKQKPKFQNGTAEPVLEAALINKLIVIKFQFPKGDQRFYDTVDRVKTLSGRRFDNPNKCWTAPLSDDTIARLRGWDFKFDKALEDWINRQEIAEVKTDIKIPGLKGEPRPFQLEGIAYVESRNGNALIGDEMGTGKTMQGLGYLQLHPELRPAIVICRASLKLNWAREVNMWMTTNIHTKIISSTNPKKNDPDHMELGKYDILIINYDIVQYWLPYLLMANPKCLIIDECQDIKNSGTKRAPVKRTVSTMNLAKGIGSVIGLSGTPIDNRPIEFFNILKMIRPTLFPSRWNYAKEFCDPKHNGFGWDFTGHSNTEKLNKIVQAVMIRRKKKDVLTELPDKIRSVIPLEIDNWDEYNKVEAKAEKDLEKKARENPDKESMRALAMVVFEKLKQAAVKGKIKAATLWIEDYIDGGEKLVVFCWHKNIVDHLVKHFGNKCVSTKDANTPSKRQQAVDKFQSDPSIKLFIGQLKRDGVGITLTAASATATIELGWHAALHDQAEDRVHRIGQESESVNAYYLLAANTVEEPIAKMIDSKRKVMNKILDGEDIESSEILMDLLESVLNRKGK